MQGVCEIGDYVLEGGACLRDVQVAYEAYGKLNADGSNAILVCHGYTAGPSMLAHGGTTGEGSWAPLIGPGNPLDTGRYFIVCANMLGSSYGTTGPSSRNPDTGERYGLAFPDITMRDIAGVQKRLMDRLGVKSLVSVLGPSFGGFQAQQWALDYPDMVGTIGVIVSGPGLPEKACADMEASVARLSLSPGWHTGKYSDGNTLLQELTELRLETLQTYGMDAVLRAEGHAHDARRRIMRRMALQWAESFDASSLVVLLKAAKQFDVRSRLSDIRADVLFVASDSDVLFPPEPDVMDAYRALHNSRRNVEVFSMNTEFGHQASGPAHALWRAALLRLLD